MRGQPAGRMTQSKVQNGEIVEGENYQSMDVMAKSGHVMLFDLYSASTDRYTVYESTTSSYNRTVHRTVTASYASGFIFKTNWP